MTPKEELLSLLVISQLPGIGPILGKTLVRHFGSALEAIHANKSAFLASPVSNEKIYNHLVANKSQLWEKAEMEWLFCQKYNIQILSFYQPEYPLRLKQLVDAPLLLFFKGNAELNATKTLAIIGTRKPRLESLDLTQQIIQDLAPLGVQIISGLAYGIDISAHRGALKNQLSTLGVLAHGLDTIYPSNHRQTAQEMVIHNSGLLTEMIHKTKLHPDLFPRRNRIVAGLSDAVLVVESKNTGGSMSTAQIARSYDREVFAIPGSPFFGYNTGTNALIKRNVAHLIESADDIKHWMKWQSESSINLTNIHEEVNSDSVQHPQKLQTSLFEIMSPVELEILNLLANQSKHIDELLILSQIPIHQLTLSLLELELKGIIKTMPGKYYSRA
jgi:DNA processing protein